MKAHRRIFMSPGGIDRRFINSRGSPNCSRSSARMYSSVVEAVVADGSVVILQPLLVTLTGGDVPGPWACASEEGRTGLAGPGQSGPGPHPGRP